MYPAIVYVLLTVLLSLSLSPAPPLTLGNVMKAVEGVKDLTELDQWLNGNYLTVLHDGSKIVVEQFLKGQSRLYQQPSWRAVIFSLDGAEETHLADRIRHYAEPMQGR